MRYTQALVRAVAGQDPRSAARAALRRNPLDVRAQTLARQLTLKNRSAAGGASRWMRRCRWGREAR